MILFFHGYQSNRNTNKFRVIQGEKYCKTVDYEALSYSEVEDLYDKLVLNKSPTMLVGHSLGGYWALKMSYKHLLPCIIINPSLFPSFDGYKPLKLEESYIPRIAHIELGDELLPMEKFSKVLKPIMKVVEYPDGNHRVKYLDDINKHIQELKLMLKWQFFSE